MFCGEVPDVAVEKKIAIYRRQINHGSTIKFKDNVIKQANIRGNSFEKLVNNKALW